MSTMLDMYNTYPYMPMSCMPLSAVDLTALRHPNYDKYYDQKEWEQTGTRKIGKNGKAKNTFNSD